jgi:hypothetical protein
MASVAAAAYQAPEGTSWKGDGDGWEVLEESGGTGTGEAEDAARCCLGQRARFAGARTGWALGGGVIFISDEELDDGARFWFSPCTPRAPVAPFVVRFVPPVAPLPPPGLWTGADGAGDDEEELDDGLCGQMLGVVFVARSMTETVLSPLFVMYAFVAESAMASGAEPTGTVAVTAFVERSMTDTELSPLFVTYAFVPMMAMASGFVPTGIVAVTVFVLRSMTETEPLSLFVTYAFVPLMAMAEGPEPMGIVAVTVFVVRSMTET